MWESKKIFTSRVDCSLSSSWETVKLVKVTRHPADKCVYRVEHVLLYWSAAAARISRGRVYPQALNCGTYYIPRGGLIMHLEATD